MLSFIHDSKRIQLSYHIQCSVPSSFQLLHIPSNVVGCFLEPLSICSFSWLGWCWVSCGVWLHAPSMRILNNWLNRITKIHSIMIGLIKSLFLYLWPSIFFLLRSYLVCQNYFYLFQFWSPLWNLDILSCQDYIPNRYGKKKPIDMIYGILQ